MFEFYKMICRNLLNKVSNVYPPSALNWNEVPDEARELYILKGYRPLSVGIVKSLTSAFALHNETLNIWTHAIPIAYFIWWSILDVWSLKAETDDLHQPLYAYILGIITLFAVSTFAHCLMSVSWQWRQVCFMLDYSAISLYGVSTARAYYHYLGHNDNLAQFFLLATSASALAATTACCWTRVNRSNSGHYIRTLSFFAPFFIASLPAITRMYEDYQFRLRFVKHILLLISGALFKVCKVPERFAPGKFDIIGHSHQVFHVLIFFGIREQFWILLDDAKRYESNINITTSSLISAFGPLLFLAGLMLIALIFFIRKGATPESHLKM